MIPYTIDIKHEINIKEEDEYFNFRKDYQVVYQNMFNINCLVEFIIDSLLNKFTKIEKIPKIKLQEVELPLFLLNTLHQANQGKNLTDVNLLKTPFLKALEVNFMNFDSEIVILQFHEMLIKFINFYISDEGYLKIIMGIYLGEKGIKYPEIKIGSKISGIFVKFVEKTKQNLASIALDSVIKLKEIVDTLVDCKNLSVYNEIKIVFTRVYSIVSFY